MATAKRLAVLVVGIALLSSNLFSEKKASQQEPKPIPVAKYKGTKERDIQLGKQYAAQVEQQMRVVPDETLTAYINRVGKRLVATGMLDKDFPYTFKVVQEPSINAFALPGGPMFVHSGLIAAAENEAQMAGVLAHELSHVSLRHGIANASKQQTISGLGGLAGAVLGSMIGGGLGELAAQGTQMGTQAWAMKYSRGAESEADLLGGYTMAKAGYNPLELANFFEKLEKEMGGDPGAVAQWFSSHPNPGNRVGAIQSQMPFMAQGPFDAREGDLDKMRKIVQGLPASPKGKGQRQSSVKPIPANSAAPDFQISQNYRPLNAGSLSLAVPDNWHASGDQQGSQLMIIPDGGVVEGGGIGAGILIGSFQPKRSRSLEEAHQELVQTLVQQNQGKIRAESKPQSLQIDGRNGLLTRMNGASPYQGGKENDFLVSVAAQNRLLYFVLVGPASRWSHLEPVYRNVLQSVRINNR
jgi:Zn-dependent protease with chaperone function